MIRTNFKIENDCVKENINNHFDEFLITFRHDRRYYYLLLVIKFFTEIFVLTFILQFTSFLKSFLFSVIFNNSHSVFTCHYH